MWQIIDTAPTPDEIDYTNHNPILVWDGEHQYALVSWGGIDFPTWENWLNGDSYGLQLSFIPKYWKPVA